MKNSIEKNIVIATVALFICTCITPTVAIDNVKTPSLPISNGNTLYVCGSGEGNYTTIQSAIDDASDGDTIYISSGTYYEYIVIDKSINLIGEDKETTIIDGCEMGDVVFISADRVNISGFTIQNSGNHFNDAGILVKSSNCSISTNIIMTNKYGIFLKRASNNNIYENIIINNSWGGLYMDFSSYNIINNNTFIANHWNAISLENTINNTISSNIIKNNEFIGIDIFNSSNNMVFNNYISEILIGCGINIDYSSFNKVYRNTITKNMFSGIHLRFSYQNHIYQNNFKNNYHYNAIFYFSNNRSHCKNIWKENYWDRPRLLPKPIIGVKILVISNNIIIPIPFPLNFDWHPAKEPYDIEGVI